MQTSITVSVHLPTTLITSEAVREGKSLRSRRYRNRRLGEFLKELDLTEGRATGIPTIQDELKANG
ncbi:MAG: AAA family ATPase, partial [Prevotella sp.]|nr:AAA family ATPase [Prevotella sp.]